MSSPLPPEQNDSTPLPTRVRKACERCRRHKSRCDESRPCSLCQRANVPCVSTSGGSGRPSRKRRMIETDPEHAEPTTPERRQRPGDGNSLAEDSDGNVEEVHVSEQAYSTVNYRAAESTIGLARKIFQLGSQSLDKLATSAIPDGGIPTDAINSGQATPQRHPIVSVLGCPLPPEATMRMLLEEYFESVHWFSLVVYEPIFRERFESVCDGHAQPSQKPFLVLLSTVLGIAAWYYSKRPFSTFSETGIDWSELATRLIQHTESQLFNIINESTVSNIQTCILLASYNSYHGKPKSAFALLGATIKTAQAIGLHRESLRGGVSALEERKRVWWTIYTWDRWASITYGRPLGINDKDCNVSMPGDVYESRRFIILSPDGDDDLICYSAYQRELNKLYIIASPMIETIFGIRSSKSARQTPGSHYGNLMKDVNWKLSEWRRCLPHHLRFDFDHDISADASSKLKAHQLQALALQLTFDHLVIVFHRPFLAQQIFLLFQGNLGASLSPAQKSPAISDPRQHDSPDTASANQELPSSEQWWSAAIRTSRVTQLPQIARLATDGHLVAFLAINLFNAAVVMVVCALSDPLSDRAQEAKRNVTRISRLQELLGKRSKLSMQSSAVLRNMIWMIVQREADAMLASIQPSKEGHGDDSNNQTAHVSPYFSVEDALRLPLFMPPDQNSHSRFATTQQGNFGPIPDDTLRLNDSLASLQRVFPGNESSALQYDNTFADEQVQGYERSTNIDTWGNNFQLHNAGDLGHEEFQYSGAADDLYWIWNFADSTTST